MRWHPWYRCAVPMFCAVLTLLQIILDRKPRDALLHHLFGGLCATQPNVPARRAISRNRSVHLQVADRLASAFAHSNIFLNVFRLAAHPPIYIQVVMDMMRKLAGAAQPPQRCVRRSHPALCISRVCALNPHNPQLGHWLFVGAETHALPHERWTEMNLVQIVAEEHLASEGPIPVSLYPSQCVCK